jgi:hypothetical protein
VSCDIIPYELIPPKLGSLGNKRWLLSCGCVWRPSTAACTAGFPCPKFFNFLLTTGSRATVQMRLSAVPGHLNHQVPLSKAPDMYYNGMLSLFVLYLQHGIQLWAKPPFLSCVVTGTSTLLLTRVPGPSNPIYLRV